MVLPFEVIKSLLPSSPTIEIHTILTVTVHASPALSKYIFKPYSTTNTIGNIPNLSKIF